jgi:hypothetical protein
MHEITFHGLHAWCKSTFEKFGWMILAHKDGDKKHVKCYCENIELLIKHIDDKIKHLNNLNKKDQDINIIDKVDDLKIMKDNLLTLHMHASKLCKKK